MSDPYAVRARTHRATTYLPDRSVHHEECRRCGKPWPCPKAGQADPEPRYRWAVILGSGAATGCLCVGFGGWLLGWWG